MLTTSALIMDVYSRCCEGGAHNAALLAGAPRMHLSGNSASGALIMDVYGRVCEAVPATLLLPERTPKVRLSGNSARRTDRMCTVVCEGGAHNAALAGT
jgi:hypothetical protein